MNWRATLGQKIRHLSPVDCRAKLEAIRAEQPKQGATIFSATTRELTGGFNSQSINWYVIRKLAAKAKSAPGAPGDGR
jgi:hypothetical protein